MTEYKKIRTVARPLLTLPDGEPAALRVDAPMFVASAGRKPREGFAPPTLMFVTDVETGLEGQIMVNQVLEDLINESYPEESYVGKFFLVTRHKLDGKKYYTFDLDEIENPTLSKAAIEETEKVPAKSKKSK